MTDDPHVGYGRQFAHFYDELFPRSAFGADEVNWISANAPAGSVDVIEYGAGTGRVAVPLAEHLDAAGRLSSFTAVDVSPEMVQQLSRHDQHALLRPVVGDVLTWIPDRQADLVLCVCGTLPMILVPDDQSTVIANAAAALRPGGRVIVEIHHDRFVDDLHGGNRDISLAVPYPGLRRILVTFASLAGRDWTLSHRWIDDETMTVAHERSRVTSVDELCTWAAAAGLTHLGTFGSLSGAELAPDSPVAVSVFELAGERQS